MALTSAVPQVIFYGNGKIFLTNIRDLPPLTVDLQVLGEIHRGENLGHLDPLEYTIPRIKELELERI